MTTAARKPSTEASRERARSASLKRLYGITPEQYDEMLEKQDGYCAVCLKHHSEFKTRLAVDHDHKTGELRGLLCMNCNHRVVGRHREPDLLLRAGRYLQGPFTGWFVPPRPKKKRKKKA